MSKRMLESYRVTITVEMKTPKAPKNAEPLASAIRGEWNLAPGRGELLLGPKGGYWPVSYSDFKVRVRRLK